MYVRVGSTNRRADPQLIAELGRYSRGRTFDERPMPELDSEAIDFAAASESFAPVRRLRRTDLETLRLVVTHQGRTAPTVGGVLLYGVDRTSQAWLDALAAAGARPSMGRVGWCWDSAMAESWFAGYKNELVIPAGTYPAVHEM